MLLDKHDKITMLLMKIHMGEVVAEPEVEGEDEAGVEVDMEVTRETIGETTKRTFKKLVTSETGDKGLTVMEATIV